MSSRFLWAFLHRQWSFSTNKRIQNCCNRSLSLKIKEHEAKTTSNFFNLLTICLKLNDEIMCLTASPNLNVKQCGEYMQEGQRKNGAAGSSLFHITLWNKNRLGLHVLTHRRTHKFSFCRKSHPISIR